MIAMPTVDDRRTKALARDLRTLMRFIELYCRDHHGPPRKAPSVLTCCDLEAVAGKPVWLCPECEKLAAHAFVKRSHCPMDPKPTCKHCPRHCYAPAYRDRIRKVMAYSGRKLVMRGRLDYLLHLLF